MNAKLGDFEPLQNEFDKILGFSKATSSNTRRCVNGKTNIGSLVANYTMKNIRKNC